MAECGWCDEYKKYGEKYIIKECLYPQNDLSEQANFEMEFAKDGKRYVVHKPKLEGRFDNATRSIDEMKEQLRKEVTAARRSL